MDFQVEATIHLDCFQDETEVVQLLRSHDFVTEHRRGNELRVKGWFVDLKSVKAHLEQLLQAQHSSSSYDPASSGAVPKNHYDGTGGAQSRSGSRNKLPHVSSASVVSDPSHSHPTSCPTRLDQHGSVSQRHTTLVVEGDVFKYVERFRREDLRDITERHHVKLRSSEVGESFQIALEGRNVREAAGDLQLLLNRLHASLRTQEIPWKDMGPKGHAVLRSIRGVYNNSVLVCEMSDGLHLVGSSAESYALKQMLLEASGRTGRTSDRGRRERSSSLPASRRRLEAQAAHQRPSEPVGADEKREGPEAVPARKTRPVSGKHDTSGPVMEAGSKAPLKFMVKRVKGLFNK